LPNSASRTALLGVRRSQ